MAELVPEKALVERPSGCPIKPGVFFFESGYWYLVRGAAGNRQTLYCLKFHSVTACIDAGGTYYYTRGREDTSTVRLSVECAEGRKVRFFPNLTQAVLYAEHFLPDDDSMPVRLKIRSATERRTYYRRYLHPNIAFERAENVLWEVQCFFGGNIVTYRTRSGSIFTLRFDSHYQIEAPAHHHHFIIYAAPSAITPAHNLQYHYNLLNRRYTAEDIIDDVLKVARRLATTGGDNFDTLHAELQANIAAKCTTRFWEEKTVLWNKPPSSDSKSKTARFIQEGGLSGV